MIFIVVTESRQHLASKLLKQEVIHAELRDQIISGKYAAGARLPTRAELEQRFGASRFTVQVALDALAREGFVRSRGRGGTVVVDRPSHLHNFAIVFDQHSRSPDWTRFLQVLADEASASADVNGRRLSMFLGAEPHVDNENYRSVLRLVTSRCLAGLIFACAPVAYEGTPLMAEDGIPRLAIMDRDDDYPVAHQVYPDLDGLFEQALKRLRQMGCRRVSILTTRYAHQSHGGKIDQLLRRFGLSCPPYWLHIQPLLETAGVRNLVHLMFRPEQANRPDGLFIADDNLVEPALAGVLASRISVPDQLKIIVHCNFPSPVPTIGPVTRLGISSSEVMGTCLSLLERIRARETVPRFTPVAPFFDDAAPATARLSDRISGLRHSLARVVNT